MNIRALAGALALISAAAGAAEVKVLSGGAVEPGLHAFAAVAKRETGHDLKIQFNTVPQIAKRLAANEVYDIVIASPAAIQAAAKDGKVVGDTAVPVGRVGAGIITRTDAPDPAVATVDELRLALLDAESVVYNTASSGLYLDKLFAKMGVLETIKPKTTRYPDGASVMQHVIRSKNKTIGFGAITEIRQYEAKGLKLVGPLPAEVQNYTSYEAAVMSASTQQEAARAVLKTLASPAGKAAFAKAGVE